MVNPFEAWKPVDVNDIPDTIAGLLDSQYDRYTKIKRIGLPKNPTEKMYISPERIFIFEDAERIYRVTVPEYTFTSNRPTQYSEALAYAKFSTKKNIPRDLDGFDKEPGQIVRDRWAFSAICIGVATLFFLVAQTYSAPESGVEYAGYALFVGGAALAFVSSLCITFYAFMLFHSASSWGIAFIQAARVCFISALIFVTVGVFVILFGGVLIDPPQYGGPTDSELLANLTQAQTLLMESLNRMHADNLVLWSDLNTTITNSLPTTCITFLNESPLNVSSHSESINQSGALHTVLVQDCVAIR